MTTSTAGIHHLGLTVPNVAQTSAFFVEALGFKIVAQKPDYPAVFVSDGVILLTLWQAQSEAPTTFDRKSNVGLHHFALRLADGHDLQAMYQTLSARSDVEIEFAPEALGASPTKHLMCTIPGGLRMEIIAPVSEQAPSK